MEFTKVKNYIEQLDSLIRKESTGPADEFAKKLGISERTLQNHIQQLREAGFEIVYDYARKTYKYPQRGSITFRFTPEDMNEIKGGKGSLSELNLILTNNFTPPENMLHNILITTGVQGGCTLATYL